MSESKTTPICQMLRDLYPTHTIIMMAAEEIERLEQKIKEMEERFLPCQQ